MKRYRLLLRRDDYYYVVPGAPEAETALDALRQRPERFGNKGRWVAMCEDGTYNEYRIEDGQPIHERGPKEAVA